MNEEDKEGEIEMNASVMKPSTNLPFVTMKTLYRTPATKENRDMVEFMDSHNFSFSVDKKINKLKSRVEKK